MNQNISPSLTLQSCARALGVKEQMLTPVGEGANGLIVTDQSGIAYKFPKNKIAKESLKKEIVCTGQISKYLSVPVPEYGEVHLDAPLGEAFCCYRLLEGVSLTPQIYARHRQRLAEQLLSLLNEIHTANIPTACGNPMDFEALYREIRHFLFPQMQKEEREQVSRRFEAYLSAPKSEKPSCVVHGDLGASNILCNPESGEITAVIDWAELSQDDPAIDYSSLSCKRSIPQCREDFLRLNPRLREVFSRMDFIQYTFPLQDMLCQAKACMGVLAED